jgi:hypothetical protein
MKPVIVALLLSVLSLLGGVAAADEQYTLAELLAANAEARGGKARLESLRALKLEVHLEEPAFEVTGTYVATADGFVRVDIFSEGKRVFTEALGPSGGWQWRSGEEQTQPLSPEGEAALRRGLVSNLYALYRWPDEGYRLSLATRAPAPENVPPSENAPLADVEHAETQPAGPVVLATDPGGFAKQLWIDPATKLVSRVYEFSALHPDLDARRTAQYSITREWMIVEGILIPRRMEKFEACSSAVIQRSTVTSALALFEEDDPSPWARPAYFEGLGTPHQPPARG